MRAVILGCCLAIVSACSNSAQEAERELDIVQQSGGSLDEICEAKRKVADAYLKAQDADKYQIAKSYADTACLDAEIGYDQRLTNAAVQLDIAKNTAMNSAR
jgi:hypothetical protein